ncbi:MAG: pimeloyl-ACP methyl ester esterase BioH, partial [Arenimonas sp.]
MHVEVRGSGPDLVLVHGWAMHGGVFATLAGRLQSRFTLHLVDLPGHGRSLHSPVPLELEAIADNLCRRLPPAIWIGWSLGGLVALAAAQRHPGRVRGLAMLCAPPRFMRGEDWPQGMEPAIFHDFASQLERDYGATIDRFLVLEAQGSNHAAEELALLRAQVFAQGEPAPQALELGLALLRNSDLRAGLPQLAMPSLWIAGRRDRLVTAAAMDAAAQLAPRARYVRVDRAGHAPFLSHVTEVEAA